MSNGDNCNLSDVVEMEKCVVEITDEPEIWFQASLLGIIGCQLIFLPDWQLAVVSLTGNWQFYP